MLSRRQVRKLLVIDSRFRSGRGDVGTQLTQFIRDRHQIILDRACQFFLPALLKLIAGDNGNSQRAAFCHVGPERSCIADTKCGDNRIAGQEIVRPQIPLKMTRVGALPRTICYWDGAAFLPSLLALHTPRHEQHFDLPEAEIVRR